MVCLQSTLSLYFFFFSSRRRHTRCGHDWSSDVCSSDLILESPDIRDLGRVEIDGFIGPAHVSTVIGTQPYEFFAEEFAKPVVISGFEPLDVMQSILRLVRQVNDDRHGVENQYVRAVA